MYVLVEKHNILKDTCKMLIYFSQIKECMFQPMDIEKHSTNGHRKANELKSSISFLLEEILNKFIFIGDLLGGQFLANCKNDQTLPCLW